MRIDRILDDVIAQQAHTGAEISAYVSRMLSFMDYDVPYTANEIMALIGLKSKETFRKNYMNPALNRGYAVMTVPDKPNSRNQRYIRKR